MDSLCWSWLRLDVGTLTTMWQVHHRYAQWLAWPDSNFFSNSTSSCSQQSCWQGGFSDFSTSKLVGGLEHFLFPYIGNSHPNWLIFFRGVETTNQQDVGFATMTFVQPDPRNPRKWDLMSLKTKFTCDLRQLTGTVPMSTTPLLWARAMFCQLIDSGSIAMTTDIDRHSSSVLITNTVDTIDYWSLWWGRTVEWDKQQLQASSNKASHL